MGEIARLLVGIAAYWLQAEAVDPGQQYADPLLPCVFCAWVIGAPIGFVGAVVSGRGRR